MTHDEMFEYVACSVCRKIPGTSHEECFSTIGRTNPLCHEHGHCRIAEKTEEQLQYVLSSIDENVFLKACPGSGKTEVVGLKAAYEIQRWNKSPGGIAVLSFTNNAADAISDRVSQFAGSNKAGYPHYIGTIDGWLHGYVAQPFAHLYTRYCGKDGDYSIRLIESFSDADFLNSFQTKYGLSQTGKILANNYYYDIQTETHVFMSGNRGYDDIRNTAQIEDWQIKDLIETKRKFWKCGFAIYQDIELICKKLFDGSENFVKKLSQCFPFIIIDECQDLSWIQLQILLDLIRNGSFIHLVGDTNQAIYEFKKVDPKDITEFAEEHSFSALTLSSNFRSCQCIIDLSSKLVEEDHPIIGHCIQKVDCPCVYKTFEKDRMADLINWFESYLSTEFIDYKEAAIVTRNWNNVSRMRPSGNSNIKKPQAWLAMSIYLWQTTDYKAINDSLEYLGKFIKKFYFAKMSANSRQQYRPESVISAIQWRIFLFRVLNECVKESSPLKELNKTWTEWARDVRNSFSEICRICISALEYWDYEKDTEFHDLDGNDFRSPSGRSSRKVIDSLTSEDVKENSGIRITTIHSVKGQEFDALMLVSSQDKKGTKDGNWKQWIEEKTSEAARLAYVASSRARHLLIWAIPEPISEEDKARLQNLGFIYAE